MRRISAALVIAIVTSSPVCAGPGAWSSSGPHGGVVYDIAGDPVDPDRLYVVSRGGVFRSLDGGANWIEANAGFGTAPTQPAPIAVDADRPQDVYAFDAYYRLYRSTDRAVSWAPTGYSLASTTLQPLGLVDVPGSVGELWLLFADYTDVGSTQIGLRRSTDNGATFLPFAAGIGSGGRALAVAFDPSDPLDVLLVRGETLGRNLAPTDPIPPTVYRSTDGGLNWSAVHSPASGTVYLSHTGGSLSFGAGSTVYASSNGQLLRSVDRGASWTAMNGSPEAVLAHPTLASTVWFHDGRQLQRSDDGGLTASVLSTGLTPNPSYLSGATPIGVAITRLWAAPDVPAAGSRMWLASEGAGLFRSLDLGASWSNAQTGLGAVNIRAVAVDPHPSTASATQGLRLFAGFGDTFLSSPALYRTPGTGPMDWAVQNTSLRAAQIRGLAIDPTTARAGDPTTGVHVYASGDGARFSDAGFRNTGLYKSTDAGASWSTLQGGLPTIPAGSSTYSPLATVRTIVLDPRSCAAEPRPPQPFCAALPPAGMGDPAIGPLQRVYAAATGIFSGGSRTHRLLVSNDAGANWAALDGNPGFPSSVDGIINHEGVGYYVARQVSPVPIVISPDDPDLLYVGTFIGLGCSDPDNEPCPDGLLPLLADPHNGVFKSTDRGATWTAVNSGLPRLPGFTNTTADALSLVMHPTNPAVLWVSMSNLTVNDPSLRPTPVYKTIDGGASWLPSATGIPHGTDIRALVVDPLDGNIVYAAGAGTAANPGSVYRSTDGGATWLSMSIGLPASSALALAVDPHNRAVLHAGTNTGVWSFEQLADADADGIPDEVEDLAPNAGDGNADGTADRLQPRVGSTVVSPGATPKARLAALQAGAFVTTEVVSGSGSCARAVDVQQRPASRFGRDLVSGLSLSYAYPFELVQFEIVDCASAVVDLTFHGAQFDAEFGWGLRYHGPATPGEDASIGWHDFGAQAQRMSANRWRLSLQANQFGSYRPVGDSILFLGGPACHDPRVFSDGGFEAVNQAFPGCDE